LRRSLEVWLLGLSLVLASACGGQGRSAEPAADRFQLAEIDGVTVATTAGGALHEGDVFVFEPIVSLREDPQRPESLLFNPVDLTVGPQGFYYVVDRGNSRVAVFDAEGNYVRAFGRGGQGPGEFGSRIVLQSLVGDVLAIWEFQAQRTTRYRTDGTFLETLRLPTAGMLLDLDRAPAGAVVATRSNRQPEDESGWESWRIDILDAAGAETLAAVATGSVLNSISLPIETAAGTMTLTTSVPFTGSPTVLHVPGRGILATDGDKPELLWHDLEGAVVRRVVIDIPERPVTEALKRDWEEREMQRRAEIATERGTQVVTIPVLRYPEAVGFWSRVYVDDAGYVWLQDVWSAHERDDGDGWIHHVIDPEGRYLGFAELPASRVQIRAGRLLAIVEGPESGEMVPTVYSILPGDAGVAYPGSYAPGWRQH